MNIKRLVVGSIDTNCYLVISENEMAVIDPGGSSDLIINEVKNEKRKLKYIINTHHHFDHSDENKKIKDLEKAQLLKKRGYVVLPNPLEKEAVDA